MAPGVLVGLALILTGSGFWPALVLPMLAWPAIRRAWRAFRRPGRVGWISQLEITRILLALALTFVLFALLMFDHTRVTRSSTSIGFAAALAWLVATWTPVTDVNCAPARTSTGAK